MIIRLYSRGIKRLTFSGTGSYCLTKCEFTPGRRALTILGLGLLPVNYIYIYIYIYMSVKVRSDPKDVNRINLRSFLCFCIRLDIGHFATKHVAYFKQDNVV